MAADGQRSRPGLTFLGGAGTVTGSKFLVDNAGTRLLIDCGLFQGARDLRRRNWDPFPVRPDELDAVVLTHADLDHCGYLPALVRGGFAGRVFATRYTADLAEIVLKDSARLLAEDAEHANRHGWSKHHPALPLYTEDDVDLAMALVTEVAHGQPVTVAANATLTLHRAGHILGSSWAELTVAGRRGPGTIVSSGDLGRPAHPLLRAPEPYAGSDVLLVESTYGNRSHGDDPARQEFAEAITRTLRRGGSVLIPAFAVDRTEVVLRTLQQLRKEGAVPSVPVLVDSPMALAALRVYQQAIASGDAELRPEIIEDGPAALDPGMLEELRSKEESMTANRPVRPSLVISASGMATGGRVLHHLRHMLPDPRNTVLVVGFAAAGTRARDLIDGARAVKIHGDYVPVRADVVAVDAFSAHADADDILAWLAAAPAPRACYVIHGEPAAAAVLRDRIDAELGWTAVVPQAGEQVAVKARHPAGDPGPWPGRA